MPIGYPINQGAGPSADSQERIVWSAPEFCLSPSSIAPEYIFNTGEITKIAITADSAPQGGSETWNILVNNITVGYITLAPGSFLGLSPTVPISVAEGDILTVRPSGTTPATPSRGITLTALFVSG